MLSEIWIATAHNAVANFFSVFALTHQILPNLGSNFVYDSVQRKPPYNM